MNEFKNYDIWKTTSPEAPDPPWYDRAPGEIIQAGNKILSLITEWAEVGQILKSIHLWIEQKDEYEKISILEALEYLQSDMNAQKAIIKMNLYIEAKELLK